MESVGQELRKERLLAGLTLDQVSAKTRISLKNLQAIENDDLPQTSSPFFYKSFVRQFAECLNIDYPRLAPAVQIAADTMPQPLIPGQFIPGQTRVDVRKIPAIRVRRRPKNFRWLYSVASLATMVVGCSTLYAFWQNAKSDWHGSVRSFIQSITPEAKLEATLKQKPVLRVPELQSRVATQVQSDVARSRVSTAKPDPIPDLALSVRSEQHSPSDSSSPSQASNQPSSDSSSALQALNEPPADSSSPSQASNQPVDSEAMFHVELSAIERTWLSIVDDGKETFSGILEAAATKVLEGHETARIRMGNAGGLSLVFNGRAIGTIGPRGQVRTVVFTKDNYEVLEPSAHISLTHFNSGLE